MLKIWEGHDPLSPVATYMHATSQYALAELNVAW